MFKLISGKFVCRQIITEKRIIHLETKSRGKWSSTTKQTKIKTQNNKIEPTN